MSPFEVDANSNHGISTVALATATMNGSVESNSKPNVFSKLPSSQQRLGQSKYHFQRQQVSDPPILRPSNLLYVIEYPKSLTRIHFHGSSQFRINHRSKERSKHHKSYSTKHSFDINQPPTIIQATTRHQQRRDQPRRDRTFRNLRPRPPTLDITRQIGNRLYQTYRK